MADAGLFVGWGPPVRGREQKGLEVFNEALAYYGGLEQDGTIESSETVLLAPHGGDLYGFTLIRGSEPQLDELRRDDDFQRLITRAGMIVEGVGVVPAALGDGLAGAVGIYQAAAGELGG